VTPVEVAPGLRRWTAWHDHWEEDVGSLAVDTADGLVLIDPIEPPPELRRPDHVLLTVYWHARGAAELKARTWAPSRSLRPLSNRGVQAENAAADLPGGIRAFQTARAAEAVYWLPEQRAVVVGDVLLGAGAKPVPQTTRSVSAPRAGSARRHTTTCGSRCGRCSTSRWSASSSRTARLCSGTARASSRARSPSYRQGSGENDWCPRPGWQRCAQRADWIRHVASSRRVKVSW
jgi:hypothetical protein